MIGSADCVHYGINWIYMVSRNVGCAHDVRRRRPFEDGQDMVRVYLVSEMCPGRSPL